ncbi:tRNA (guanine(9)-N1)-methyltransferase [Diplonema papillatum]|nr:tRNA (guanine(9)-N1)-methyltransferase [Diplonema papillatum]|eukprot:gene15122-23103_t
MESPDASEGKGGEDRDREVGGVPGGEAQLSKKKQKRLKRLGGEAGIAEHWERKKKEYKQRVKERKEAERKNKEAEWLSLSTEEQQRRKDAARAQWEKVGEEKKALEARIEAAKLDPTSRYQVVIDLDYENEMDDRSIKSMVQQVSVSFSHLRKAGLPCWLTLAGLKKATDGGKIAKQLTNRNGFDNWPMTIEHRRLPDLFASKDKPVVYLSGDSPNTLEKLEHGTYYVVGGIVDRNQHKGISLQKAETYGFGHAKLPLDAFLADGRQNLCKTLTTNHAVAVLAHFAEHQKWNEAFESILPKRRVLPEKRKAADASDEDSEEQPNGSDDTPAAESSVTPPA